MVVRIRISVASPKVKGPSTEMMLGLAGLLTLFSVSCFAMSAWKILWEMGWAGRFFIAQGVLSHWQVWITLAVIAQLLSFWLSRPRALIS